MSTSSTKGQIQPIVAFALGAVAAAAFVGAIAFSRPGAAPSGGIDRPSSSPSASPSTPATPAPATPTPSPVVTPAPSNGPSQGAGAIPLRNATGRDVVALVHDQTGSVAGAASGHPGDGMSVRWHDALVENADADTILVTWVGLPQDDVVDIGVALVAGRLQVTIVQAGPVPYSDAMGEDRIIELAFDGAVDADEIVVEVLDRTVD